MIMRPIVKKFGHPWYILHFLSILSYFSARQTHNDIARFLSSLLYFSTRQNHDDIVRQKCNAHFYLRML